MPAFKTLEWKDDALTLLDQRLLPDEVRYLTLRSADEVAQAIRDMAVRGAPAIGAAAAFGLALAARTSPGADAAGLLADLRAAADRLQAARPTAVNLNWALTRVLRALENAPADPEAIRATALDEAQAVAEEDIRANRQIGLNALPLLPDEVTFIHHCNTGALATVDYGTALGVIRAAYEHGKKVFVYVDETRPRLQGARLTAWELQQLGIPHQIIVDGASGYVMKTRRVDAVVVGCDRVAANGDTANKIGTYNLALAARAHRVPFYVCGPTSTIDLNTPSGEQIPIEERPGEEITRIGGLRLAPAGSPALNPAFDITPAELISAIITEGGVARPPFDWSLPMVVAEARRLFRQG
jgi:methylthioribose-1-phosphate isomerase